MEIVGLFLSLIVLLFSLHSLSRDDFILLRKNISMDQIFNISFLAIFVGLFAARLLYVIAHLKVGYLNPLVFFALPYFPGVSAIGGVIGAVLFIYYYTSYKKIHKERLFDFFNTSLLFSLSFGYVLRSVVLFSQKKHFAILEVIIPILLIILAGIYLFFLLPKHRRGEMKDGHIGLIFLSCFSGALFIIDVITKGPKLFRFIGLEGVISLIVLIITTSLLLKREKRVIKFSKIRI